MVNKEWQVVLRQSTGKVVLYHSSSNRLSVHHEPSSSGTSTNRSLSSRNTIKHCPLCLQSLNILPIQATSNSTAKNKHTQHEHTVTQDSYFELLSQSQCNTPRTSPPITPLKRSCNSSIDSIDFNVSDQQPLSQDKRIDGYYQRFFKEVMKLGRGQKGSVFLCTHTLDGNPLGDYAIKKIAVGQSSQELIQVLNEVKFLESLRHNNITQYHHAWIEESQLSRFGPKVPVLYILMNFANGGTLDDYISLRKGIKSTGTSSPNDHQTTQDDAIERNRMKDRFRKQQSNLHSRLSTWNYPSVSQDKKGTDDRAVHLFSFDEILNIFEDTCRGLGFLHSQGILHHDLKTENVLLHWASEDAMIPTAMISDFGSSISQSENWSRERTGRTGTLDWVPPESLKKDPKTGKLNEVTQKGDLWQLGLVLHSLCFFRLPYAHSEDIDLLKDEITRYPGFLIYESAGESERKMNRSDLPRSMIKLLSELLCLEARSRPSCERVLRSLEKIRDSIPHESPVHHPHQKGSTTVLQPEGFDVPFSYGSALVKRRRIFIDSSDPDLSSPDLKEEEEEEGDTSKELTMVTRSTSSSSSTSTTTTSPRSTRTALLSPFITPDEHLNQLYDPRPRLLKPIHFPQSSLNHLHHSYFFRIFVHRFAPSAYPRIIKLLERPYFAPFFAMVICIKSLLFLKIIVFIGSDYHPFKHHQVIISSSSSNTGFSLPNNQNQIQQDYSLDQFLVAVMSLIIFNTLELLMCDPLVSVLVLIFQTFWFI
ncbi:IKS protein kinase [Puccinia striiformis f. sp. tritici PST-78]|uniref:non-specific serine/threonine protein kinase n=1 Tax=Puccinia striiformis f. sp. tritici PST-78 TaxID=1165861 RepID=A0A0L0VHI1_9BASI|nr:IKS protein kinase [Puccinia striiformis f. sp. tritici PST-78]